MSATIAETCAVPPTNAQPLSPVDYIRALPPESQEEVFAALLLELIEINDGGIGLIPCDFAGKSLGYYVPPKAASEFHQKTTSTTSPEFDPDDCLTDEQLRELNRQIDADEFQQSQSS